jgi:hypothetical protein
VSTQVIDSVVGGPKTLSIMPTYTCTAACSDCGTLSVSFARELELPTRLVTNAHWAATPKRARERLQVLIDAGLDEINYSTGDEHVRFVPLERVLHAAVAAVGADIPVVVMVELRRQRVVTAQTIRCHPLIRLLGEDAARVKITESAWMPLDPSVPADYDSEDVAVAANLHMRRGCSCPAHLYRPGGRKRRRLLRAWLADNTRTQPSGCFR